MADFRASSDSEQRTPVVSAPEVAELSTAQSNEVISSDTTTTTTTTISDDEIKMELKLDSSDPLEPPQLQLTWKSFPRLGPQRAFSLPATPPALPTMSVNRQKFIAIQCGIFAMTASINSSVMLAVVPPIQEEFGITTLQVNIILTLSILLFAIAPLGWAPLSDRIGRRPVLLSSQIFALIGSIICVFAPEWGSFAAGRLIQMAGSGACISVGAGVISDVFERDQRGRALGVLNFCMLVGPILAPPIAGVIAEYWGMRQVFSFTAVCNALMFGLIFGSLPETLERIRRRAIYGAASADEVVVETGLNVDKEPGSVPKDAVDSTPQSLPTPPTQPKPPNTFTALYNLRHPFILLSILAPAVGYGAYYAIAANFARDLTTTYSLSVSTTGFISVSLFAGMMLGSIGGGTLADHLVITLRHLRGVFIPEDRLKAAWLSALISPLGPPLYGWTIALALPWPIVLPAFIMIGFCNFLLQTVCTTYLVDLFPSQPAAMVSVLNCMRWIFGALAPILSVPGYQMGVGWYYTLIGAVGGATAGLMMGVAFVPWFALDRLGKAPWVSGDGREKQVEAVERGGEGIEWVVVLWGGGRFRKEALRAKKEEMDAKAEKKDEVV